MKLTELEKEVLMAIYNSEYQDTDEQGVINYPVWSYSIADNVKSISGKQISGVMSSLIKKGYAGSQDNKGYGADSEGTCWITEKGYNFIKELENHSELISDSL